MFPTLKRLYDLGLLKKDKIAESAKYKWITKEQYKEITGEVLPEATD
ncbi:XkdX family protein [Mammaliicoccus sciuri]